MSPTFSPLYRPRERRRIHGDLGDITESPAERISWNARRELLQLT